MFEWFDHIAELEEIEIDSFRFVSWNGSHSDDCNNCAENRSTQNIRCMMTIIGDTCNPLKNERWWQQWCRHRHEETEKRQVRPYRTYRYKQPEQNRAFPSRKEINRCYDNSKLCEYKAKQTNKTRFNDWTSVYFLLPRRSNHRKLMRHVQMETIVWEMKTKTKKCLTLFVCQWKSRHYRMS